MFWLLEPATRLWVPRSWNLGPWTSNLGPGTWCVMHGSAFFDVFGTGPWTMEPKNKQTSDKCKIAKTRNGLKHPPPLDLPTLDPGHHTPDLRPQTQDLRTQSFDLRCRTPDLRPQTPDLRPQTSDPRPQTLDLRPQTAGPRPQTPGPTPQT